MKTYFAILKCRYLAIFQYRASALAGLCTQVFWGLIKVMVLTAFFSENTQQQPLTLAQAITFVWLGQALIGLLPWSLDKEIEEQIKTGNVAFELVRPIHLYWLWFFRALAVRIAPTSMRCMPIFLLATLFFGLDLPVSPAAGVAFLFSLVFSAILAASITTFVMVSLLWTISGEGLQRLLPHVIVLLSGMIVPLPLFPDWMQGFLSIQPFRGIVDIPSRLYTGIIPAHEALFYLGFQCLWAWVFIMIGKALIFRGLKKLTIQGG